MQTVRFCTTPDGIRIAYASHGSGPPLVRTATWLTHLEFDWKSPVWRHWLDELAQGHTVFRYDERGCGLSDRDVEDLSLDARVADLAAVIDAAGLERVALLGMSHGGPLAIAYAALHQERISHLILFATHARGRLMRDPSPSARDQAQLMMSLIRMGWGQDQPAFRRLFTTLFIPGATAEQMQWFDELQRVTTDPETAVRLRQARNRDEVTREATQVASRALVLHARDDALVPFAEGRLLATLIPGARFVPLESRNHILLADEPAWPAFLAELRAFPRHGRGRSARRAVRRSEQPRSRGSCTRRRGAAQPGDRVAVVHQRANRRAPPLEHLREARRFREGSARRSGRPLRAAARVVCASPQLKAATRLYVHAAMPPTERAEIWVVAPMRGNSVGSSSVIEAIGMRAHGPLRLERFGNGELEGWSAMQFIETSSITVHADELSGRCFVDVFSCRQFDAEIAAAIAIAHFGGRHTLRLLQR